MSDVEADRSGRRRILMCGYSAGGLTAICLTNAVADFAGKEASLAYLREAWVDWTRWWMWILAWIVGSTYLLVRAGFHKRVPHVTITLTRMVGGQPTPVKVIDAELVETVKE